MQGVDHYENFPVASWLCPPQWRAPVVAIYRFARTADDLADEGTHGPAQRLADLQAYRDTLLTALQHPAPTTGCRWPDVFVPLARQIEQHRLPVPLLLDLLDAFEQDVRHSANGHRYADLAELQDYCRRSARPIGRLLLHLYGVHDPHSLQQSDAICDALQLINFWQDLGQDLARGRHYLPEQALQRHGVRPQDLHPDSTSVRAQPLVRELCEQARALMQEGAPLALRLPGRTGWELRLVVQGGLRVLQKIERLGYRTWHTRPTLRLADLPVLLWRAWRMPPSPYTRQP